MGIFFYMILLGIKRLESPIQTGGNKPIPIQTTGNKPSSFQKKK